MALVPYYKNEDKPKSFYAEIAIFILSAVLVLETIFFFKNFVLIKTDFFASLLPEAIVNAANGKRIENGQPILKVNRALQRAAEFKANDMARKGYFSHNSPGGKTPWYWIEKVKYNYNYAGENLALNFVDSLDLVDAWMNSETHKENMLDKNYTETGIAVKKGVYEGKEAIFIVQFFASPAEE